MNLFIFQLGFLFFSFFISLSSGAIAAGGGEVHQVAEWSEVLKPLIYRIFNFAIFVGILVYFGRKPVAKFLNERSALVKEAIETSKERKDWAEKKYEEYNQRLEGIDKEIEVLQTSLKQEGEMESKKVIANAEKLAESIRNDAKKIAGAEMDDLKESLRSQAIEMAARAAKDTIEKVMDSKDEERIENEFIQELRSQKA